MNVPIIAGLVLLGLCAVVGVIALVADMIAANEN